MSLFLGAVEILIYRLMKRFNVFDHCNVSFKNIFIPLYIYQDTSFLVEFFE